MNSNTNRFRVRINRRIEIEVDERGIPVRTFLRYETQQEPAEQLNQPEQPEQPVSSSQSPPKPRTKGGFFRNLALGIGGIIALAFVSHQGLKSFESGAFETGKEQFEQGQYDEAINSFDRVLSVNPDNTEAAILQGQSFQELGDTEVGIQLCDSALNPRDTFNPEISARAHRCKGRGLTRLGKNALAINSLVTAYALTPSNPDPLLELAEPLLDMGESERTIATAELAIRLLIGQEAADTNAKLAIAHTQVARGYQLQKEYRSVLYHAEKALHYNPDYFLAKLLVTEAMKNLGYPERAEKFFQTILKSPLTPGETALTHFYRGLNFCHTKKFFRGIRSLKQAMIHNSLWKAASQAIDHCAATWQQHWYQMQPA